MAYGLQLATRRPNNNQEKWDMCFHWQHKEQIIIKRNEKYYLNGNWEI